MKAWFSMRWHPDEAVHMMIKIHQTPSILSASFKKSLIFRIFRIFRIFIYRILLYSKYNLYWLKLWLLSTFANQTTSFWVRLTKVEPIDCIFLQLPIQVSFPLWAPWSGRVLSALQALQRISCKGYWCYTQKSNYWNQDFNCTRKGAFPPVWGIFLAHALQQYHESAWSLGAHGSSGTTVYLWLHSKILISWFFHQ